MRPTVPLAAIAAAFASGAGAGADVIADTTFNDSDWTMSISTFYNPGSVSGATQAVGAGFTGNARQVSNAIAGFGSGVYSFNILTTQGWDGGFDLPDVSFSMRTRSIQSIQACGFAIEQGGSFWVAEYFITGGDWDLRALTATAADFDRPFGVDPSSQAEHPDFSAGAAPIRFGFYAGNSSSPSGGAYNTMALYSDFSVSFVPTPATLAVFGLAGAARSRRRR